ncbi:MAG: sugar ABC transporter substrate-binding protein, partial [Treponema sp.]|nr:sugar ABC transporter substrate-binding protein [Treponema sp.]
NDYEYGVANGTNAAKWINEKLGGKAEVLLITLDHVETVKLRGDGMEDTIKKLCPNAVIVARQYAENMETAMNITETVLQAHPNLNAIACVNDQHAIGALEAVKNMGIKNDNFYIGGADYTDEGVQKMKEPGSYFRVTADIQPDFYGAYGAEKLYQYATTGPVEETQYFAIKAVWATDL